MDPDQALTNAAAALDKKQPASATQILSALATLLDRGGAHPSPATVARCPRAAMLLDYVSPQDDHEPTVWATPTEADTLVTELTGRVTSGLELTGTRATGDIWYIGVGDSYRPTLLADGGQGIRPNEDRPVNWRWGSVGDEIEARETAHAEETGEICCAYCGEWLDGPSPTQQWRDVPCSCGHYVDGTRIEPLRLAVRAGPKVEGMQSLQIERFLTAEKSWTLADSATWNAEKGFLSGVPNHLGKSREEQLQIIDAIEEGLAEHADLVDHSRYVLPAGTPIEVTYTPTPTHEA